MHIEAINGDTEDDVIQYNFVLTKGYLLLDLDSMARQMVLQITMLKLNLNG